MNWNDNVGVTRSARLFLSFFFLCLATSPLAYAQVQQAGLVRTISPKSWSHESLTPSGIAYFPPSDGLLITDSDIDNQFWHFVGVQLWQTTLSGSQVQEYGTNSFSDQPTGVAYNPGNGHLFFTDDSGARSVYELDPGPDGLYDTADDVVTSFSTSAFSCTDPQGIAYDTWQGHLFIADGANSEIFEVDPGPNGLFDGVDDVVSQFDTDSLGLSSPKGVEFNPDTGNLYLVGEGNKMVFETTRGGTQVGVFDISSVELSSKQTGVAYGPNSLNPSEKSLYVVDSYGKIYEFSLGSSWSLPQMSIGYDNVIEGDAGTVDAVFPVTLSEASEYPVTVTYHTKDANLIMNDDDDGDYIPVSGELIFAPGETSKEIIVEVIGDTILSGLKSASSSRWRV